VVCTNGNVCDVFEFVDENWSGLGVDAAAEANDTIVSLRLLADYQEYSRRDLLGMYPNHKPNQCW